MRTSGRACTLAAAALTVASVLALASGASAHVTVSSPNAAPGGFGKLVFSVPNESDSASTVAFSVTLPVETPFAFVSTKVKDGWRVTQKSTTLSDPVEIEGFTISKSVTAITWTATGSTEIGPGEFDEFEVSAGPFPDTEDDLLFPATQTYSDGDVVDWDEPMNADGSEPEHPAPALSLGGDTGEHHGASEEAAEEDDAPADAPTVSATSSRVEESDSGDGIARAFGAGGLVLGALGLLAGAVAIRRSRSS